MVEETQERIYFWGVKENGLETIEREKIMDSEERQKKIEARNKQQRERELNDINKVLKIPEGRRLIWRIMSEAKIFQSSFTGNDETFLREGMRIIGLSIFNDVIKVAPEVFLQMQREYRSEQESIRKEIPPESDEL